MRIRYNTYNNKNHLFSKNRQINDNLEQQAQALFKAWFVDNPKPNWSETTFSEVANFIGGYSYKGEELTDSSNIAMVTIKNFGRNGGFKADGFKGIAPFVKLKECHYANLFDILVAHTDLTQNADVIGNAELLLTYDRYDSIIFSMDLVKVLPKNNFPYRFLLAAMLKNKIFKGHCLGYVNGTTVLHLSKKALPNFEVKIPPKAEAKTMNDAFAPYYQRMAEVLQENDRLIHLRDTLLPKLMSGELNINAKSRLQ
ncbi:restriction endonuclease subunit S [Bacteroides finegoldii]|uniref:restriction endonuclease subunit S n=1 Tax=Bacteroides finegoldii TaxID=338188 RepID=UPI0035651256